MNKNLLLCLIMFFLTASQGYALEDYIVMSDKSIDSVVSKDEGIVSATPFHTLENSKSVVLLKVKQLGKTELEFKFEDDIKIVNIEVFENKTKLSNIDGFTYFVLDLPEEPIEILPPPSIRGGK